MPVNALGVQVPLNSTNIVADLSGALGLPILSPDADTPSKREGDTTVDQSCANGITGDANG